MTAAFNGGTKSWELESSTSIDIELLLMQRRIALHDHGLLGQFLHLSQSPAVIGLERLRYFGIHPQHHVCVFQMFRDLSHLQIDLVAHRSDRLHEPCGLAVRTRRPDGALERLLHPLTS